MGWAAFFNFVAAAPVLWGSELRVAATMGKGIVEFPTLQARGPTFVLVFIFAALVGAILWNLLTWWWGSSSSSMRGGGMIGACLVAIGPNGLIAAGIWKIVLFIALSPIIGMVLGSLMMVATAWIVRKNTPARVDRWFRRLQLVSASIFSYSHGTNDAQKVMGIITVILYGTVSADRSAMTPGHFSVPFWVVLACHAVHRTGHAVRRLAHREDDGPQPDQAAAHRRLLCRDRRRRRPSWRWPRPASRSPPPTPSPAPSSASARRRGTRAVRWGVAGRIVWAWIFTIPMAALFAALTYGLVRLLHGPY